MTDRTGAERLREAYLEIEVDRDAELAPGELYWHEVEGMTVRDSTGRELGEVAEIYRVGATEVYTVRGGPVGEFELPAVRDVVGEISRERREIVVDEAVLALDAEPVDERPKAARARPRWSRHGKGGREKAAQPPDGATDPGT